MEKTDAILALSALAQSTRLECFSRLVKALPEAIPAGDLAAALNVPQNTLSTHLALLAQAGLVSSERQGRSILYRAEIQGLQSLVGFLLQDCCAGRPDICAPVLAALTPCEPKGTCS